MRKTSTFDTISSLCCYFEVGLTRLLPTEIKFDIKLYSKPFLLQKSIFCIFNPKKIDFELKKVLLPPPPLGNFADISYLEENFKPHLLRDVCTLCSGALVSDSLLHMLL